MYKHTRLAAVLGCAATLAMVGCSTTNSGLTPSSGTAANVGGSGWTHQDGVFRTPHYMKTYTGAKGQAQPLILLTYRGGAVLTKPKMYLILWGFKKYGDPNKVKKLLKSYSKQAGGSGYYNILTQYYMTSGGSNIYITNPSKIAGGLWDDETNAVPASPSDSQVEAEALAGVAHFGYDPQGSYVVATPHGHNSPGFGTSFCAYHDSASYQGQTVSYTNLPYMPDAGYSCGAGIITPPKGETSANVGVTIVEGHEYSESVTDPVPGAGWYNNSYGEIGDICAWQNIQNDPMGKKSFASQPEFSNASQSCVHSYP